MKHSGSRSDRMDCTSALVLILWTFRCKKLKPDPFRFLGFIGDLVDSSASQEKPSLS